MQKVLDELKEIEPFERKIMSKEVNAVLKNDKYILTDADKLIEYGECNSKKKEMSK